MSEPPGGKLRPAASADLDELMTWFPDERATRRWGGPDFRFPFTRESFRQDCRWPGMASFCLVGERDELFAFGQFYERDGRANLARLVVSPAHRRQGLGRRLIEELMSAAALSLDCDEASLFVYRDNRAAIGCYRALGFETSRPEATRETGDDILYLVRPLRMSTKG